MNLLINGVLGSLLVAGALFLGCLARTAMGAIVGFVVALVFTDTMHLLMVWIGQPQMELWQLGAILGFLTSFIPTGSK